MPGGLAMKVFISQTEKGIFEIRHGLMFPEWLMACYWTGVLTFLVAVAVQHL